MLKNNQWFLGKELLMEGVGFLLQRSWFGFFQEKENLKMGVERDQS